MWYRTGPRQDAALIEFLGYREELHMGLLSRILRDGRIMRPNRIAGGLFARNGTDGSITDALLLTTSGYIHPALSSDTATSGFPDGDNLLALVASRCSFPSSVTGPERDVLSLLKILDVTPRITNKYFIMVRGTAPGDPSGAEEGNATPPMPAGVTIRRAGKEDLDALYPLQEAYEREEVITPIHRFQEISCRRNLERSLAYESVYLAECDGVPVAKAQTNARGFRFRQLGGIYVKPERRNMGIGSGLVGTLCGEIESGRRSTCLFVKRENGAAIRAYERCGFAVTEDFMIGYFS